MFPLDEGAAVCGFETIGDGTLVIGDLTELEAALQGATGSREDIRKA